ncbi:MAG: glycosyltransferase family 39 protein [Proteobacteria bacterium]|nr:glycosyltransferase family 39 protein [Pseudomonadota bacterium]
MTALAVLVLEITACLGLGAVVLRLLNLLATLKRSELLPWSFAIGYGALGWLLFFAGVAGKFSVLPLAALLGLGTFGLVALRGVLPPPDEYSERTPLGPFDFALLAALAIALVFDLLEGLAPPADADSLAYHFALAKQFIAEERLFFVERALDGAVPLLNQMTYVPALALGGEKGLTLWTMVSGWAATALLFSVCRRYLDRRWSLAIAVIFLTTPTVVYGGGSGQVEVRNTMFAIIAAFSVARAVTTDDLRHAALAGVAVGFFMAGKYIGLLFALSCGLAILLQRRWFMYGFVLTIVAFVAGGQWYVWNAIHTGDPFFPLLFEVLGNTAVPFWNHEQHATLQRYFLESEQAVPTNILWLVLYPFVAALSGYPQFESGRTGFGPFILLVLPLALAGAWQYRERIKQHPLLIVASITLLFYAFWFLIGSSQRVRHLMPVLPLALLILTFAAHRWARAHGLLNLLMAATLITVGIQLAGSAVFSLNYVRHFISGETRQAFLHRNVSGYDIVPWVNQNLTSDDRLYLHSRQLNYLLRVPYFYAHTHQESWVDTRPEASDPSKFLHQLRKLGITHLLVAPGQAIEPPDKGLNQWRPLLRAGCVEIAKEIETLSIGSRSLGSLSPNRAYILKMTNEKCTL